LNKLALIRALQDETDISKADAHAVVDIFFGNMADALVKGRRVEIRGLWADPGAVAPWEWRRR